MSGKKSQSIIKEKIENDVSQKQNNIKIEPQIESGQVSSLQNECLSHQTNQQLKNKINEEEVQFQKFNRLKRNIIDSDDEQNINQNNQLNFDQFIFNSEKGLKEERKSLATYKKDDTNKKGASQKEEKQQNKRNTNNKTNQKKENKEDIDDGSQEQDSEIKKNQDFKNLENTFNVYEEFDDVTPKWAAVGASRDKEGNLHGTPQADPTTLLIPKNEFQKLTSSMRQYWTIKSQNFDKIIFFKLGKFYELFYDDAYIGNKYLDLNWMGRKMHTGFPERAVHKYKALLLEYGYKAVIVDQTETPEQMKIRVDQNKKMGKGNTDKIVERQISEILTKGTYLYEEGEQQINLDEKTLMVIRKHIIDNKNQNYGIAMLERQTNTITLAFIECKDNSFEKLKTLFLHMRPIETIIDQINIPEHDPIFKMIKGNVIKSIISYLRFQADNWDSRKSILRIEQYIQNQNLPQAINHYKNNNLVLEALNGLFSYLDSILIMDKVLGCARYKVYDEQFSLQQCMILDSQALYHLEILESAGSTQKKDLSLFGIINKTTTPGGHRMLKKWLCSPLYQVNQIKERQDSIKDISKFRKERDLFRQSIKDYPDLERLASRIYEYSIKSESKAVFYENLSLQRLREFKNLTNKLEVAQQEISLLSQLKENFISDRLKKLMTLESEGGLLPNVQQQLEEFQQYIIWRDNNIPQPIEGILEEYDQSVQNVKLIEQEFQEYLIKIRKDFKNNKNINLVKCKYRYEIEMPAELVEHQKPDNFEFASSKAGFKRYITQELKDMITKLEDAEDQEKQQLNIFGRFIFKHFKQNYQVWDKFINILNELDTLCSLSVFGETFEGKMCWPNFINDQIKLVIKQGKHPCLTNINFVPNSIDLGDNLCKFQLLTGPNMGGKSTTLRMVCVLAILAQLGCQVPCEEMTLSPVDRIFTRIGAKDYLMESKSTFYVELEETLVPLKYGTKNSLFITDELGRGTSTYDGVAIASAVMHYLINRIGCRVLFATHFRILIEETKLRKDVTNVHMASYVENGKVIFLYTLRLGECPASFGINVAKAVGINYQIIERAQEMADFFENKVNQKNSSHILTQFNQIVKEYDILK